jgi:imidazolonepropionase-like amidohydrolase
MAGWLWDASGMRQAWIEERVPRIQWETANHAALLDRSLDLMTPQNAPRWAPAWLARLAAPFMRSAETGRRELASSMRATRALYEAGVPIVMGADAGNWPAFATFFHGVGSLLEMELLEKAGIPRSEIIVAATSRPARMLKQEHRIGTIAPGKDADLVIIAQNPIEHGMQAMHDIRWVIQGGLAKTPAAWLHD